MDSKLMKQAAARKAISFIEEGSIVGIGSGSTVNYFIEELASHKYLIEGTVASSEATAHKLREHHFPVFDLNGVNDLPLYIDSADEINLHLQMIKGGGGALTREKIIAAVAKQFICIADHSKKVEVLGTTHFIPLEVIPMARSYVARQIVKLGGDPVYRAGYTTDNGNIILDIHNLPALNPVQLEQQLNNITGVVACGIFAQRPADLLLLASETDVQQIKA